MAKVSVHEILEDKDFKDLLKRRNRVALTLTVVELLIYFGFIALIAFNKPFLSQKMSAGTATTVGIPIAVGTIALSWVLTGIYIFWANSRYDTLVKKIKEKIGG
ncbi:MAG: DUF485 domain-containing protein [Nitrospiraceae bacterium]|nr:DUF485 domain-containing protein [Nitrospiraceae bacterium]